MWNHSDFKKPTGTIKYVSDEKQHEINSGFNSASLNVRRFKELRCIHSICSLKCILTSAMFWHRAHLLMQDGIFFLLFLRDTCRSLEDNKTTIFSLEKKNLQHYPVSAIRRSWPSLCPDSCTHLIQRIYVYCHTNLDQKMPKKNMRFHVRK